MSIVTLDIVNQKYALGCEDGQEERLHQLSKIVDAKARAILNAIGPLDEKTLLATVCIVLADELQSRAPSTPNGDIEAGLEKLLQRLRQISKKLP